jgi:Na+/H+ antiporter NhaB
MPGGIVTHIAQTVPNCRLIASEFADPWEFGAFDHRVEPVEVQVFVDGLLGPATSSC